MKIYGEILKPPKLKFRYSLESSEEENPRKGLKEYGPYDQDLSKIESIKCIIMYPEGYEKEKRVLTKDLIYGNGIFKGFKTLFRIPLEITNELSFRYDINYDLEEIYHESPDIVIIILPHSDTSSLTALYRKLKIDLLCNGIPSQMIIAEKLRNPYRQYIIENIALAIYAKIGGTPWTISAPENEENLIIGVSRAKDTSRNKYLVGFVTVFTNDGHFLFVNSKAPVIEWDRYVEGLTKLIRKAIEEYKKRRGKPHNIIVHFHKRPGKKEIKAIESGLQSKDIPYAIIHLNEYSNFRVFYTAHHTYIPPKGLKVKISNHEVLLLLDGLIDDRRNRMGVPKVLNIRMDRRSTLGIDKFRELVKQIFDFSFINWRGFNATATPITLNYSKLIARMVRELGAENWNQIIAEGKLRDKSWFL